ncbi:LacI family DNA-binding transcriptional regulator [Isobaculum melis]|uniref:Transcriptional regulator, LacI family n=1 Tax=Isobaculum melis TaxID=142588 RepID=A0A1H9PZX0_9LACT|nr:LacI family DNA-binding transcriptional regulator [Isobaculum melis]SER53700.1 transcriptional regulator, LacI family [Isobaculum melis]
MNQRKVSIKEIAELSGVSVATVSRVINNNGRFSEETRKKVLQVIKDTHYETNNIAKSLRMKKSNTIGILVPDISNSFFANVVQEIESILFKKGYSTIICNTDRNEEKEEAYLRMLEGKMIDGLIVISGVKEFGSTAINKKTPLICIDRKPKDTKSTILIESDHYQGGFLATEELISKGCHNIAIIIHRDFLSSSKERLLGYQNALKKYQIPFKEENVIHVTVEEKMSRTEAAKAALLQKISEGYQFDGVFALNDRLAIGAIHAILDLGKKVPEDIKVVGFDNDPISKYCYPCLTTIRQDNMLIAEQACENLLALIDGTRKDMKKHQVIPVTLVSRAST